MERLELIEEHRCFGGVQRVYAHQSWATNCKMRFALFLPPQQKKRMIPVLYWLSGLTCNEQNFITKAGAQKSAAELGLAIVAPDTSPRDVGLPGENEHNDFGVGAGFYLNAVQAPWSHHYRMFDYVTEELPTLLNQHFPLAADSTGILGHSMGGHGALIAALKKPQQYRSVSAFAPIASLIHSPWGKKALLGYLGADIQCWKDYDACELMKQKGWPHGPILIDQGTKDVFLHDQLNSSLFQTACSYAGVTLNLRMQKGYDHSYYFIASFINEHLRFHAALLK